MKTQSRDKGGRFLGAGSQEGILVEKARTILTFSLLVADFGFGVFAWYELKDVSAMLLAVNVLGMYMGWRIKDVWG